MAIFQVTELKIKANPPCFARARAHVRALMTRKSCAVEMRNAILRNYLKAPAKRSQHANATCRNIVGRNMLRAFGRGNVAICCVGMLRSFGRGLRTFAPIATAHLHCARYSLVTHVPRHFQARAPSRKLNKI